MKIIFLALVCVSSMIYGNQNEKDTRRNRSKAVTYDQGGGRFGDQFLGYLHAKWISYRYGIPLLYKPFSYSDQLVLHYEEKHFNESEKLKFFREFQPSAGMQIDYSRNLSVLYVIPYFPESKWEINNSNGWYYFPVDWKDEGFRKELKRLIRPVNLTPFLDLPGDRVSVAVHARKGGGFDASNTWTGYPMKLPPDSYYIDQIKKIYELFQGRALYVYLFTDDQNPLQLIEKYQRQLPGMDIEFDCRKEGNHHAANVLEDFFEMTRFDCLIRPDSNYSIVASKIADYQVVISPAHFIQRGDSIDSVYIDEVEIELSPNFLNKN